MTVPVSAEAPSLTSCQSAESEFLMHIYGLPFDSFVKIMTM